MQRMRVVSDQQRGGERASRSGGGSVGPMVAGLVLALLTLLCAGVPLAAGLWMGGERAAGMMTGRGEPAGIRLTLIDPGRLIWTFSVCGGIGVVSVLLAWPAAWWVSRLRLERMGTSAVVALGVAPMLLPAFILYAGWSVLRAEGTWLYGYLATGPVWLSIAFGRGVAIGSLALWAWPIATGVLAMSVRRVPAGCIEALAQHPGSWVRTTLVRARLVRGGLVSAWGVVVLLMLGSVVPLHVAQVPTFGIRVWTVLDLTAHAGPGWAWAIAWPVLVPAIVGAVWVTSALGRGDASAVLSDARPVGRSALPVWHGYAAGLAWLCAVVVPTFLLAWSLRDWSSLGQFWRENGGAVWASVRLGGMVGVVTGVMGVLACFAVSDPLRRGTRWVVLVSAGVLVAAALVPGVLYAATFRQVAEVLIGWGVLHPRLADSEAMLVAAHIGRIGLVGVLIGLWLGLREERELRDTRRMLGAVGFRSWWRACGVRLWGAWVGAGLAGGLLSFFEIETAVILTPVGVDRLARILLEDLHYNQEDRLASAVLWTVGCGLVVAWVSVWLIGGARRDRVDGGSGEPLGL